MRPALAVALLALSALACVSLQPGSVETALPAGAATATPVTNTAATLAPAVTLAASPTPEPIATERPRPAGPPELADAALTLADVAGLRPDLYLEPPVDITRNLGRVGVARHALMFIPALDAGRIDLYLIQFSSSEQAQGTTEALKAQHLENGELVELPLALNGTEGLVHRPDDNDAVLFFSSGPVSVYLGLALGPDLTLDEATPFLAQLGAALLARLEAAGYK